MSSYRFTRQSCSRFTSVILQLAEGWPQVIKVNTQGMSVETYRSRFRDAVRGIIIHNIFADEPQIKSACEKIWSTLRIEEQPDGTLLIGDRGLLSSRRNRDVPAVGLVLDATAVLTSDITSPSSQVLNALVTLLTHSVLDSCTLTNTSEEFIQAHIPPNSPVELIENAPGKYTLFARNFKTSFPTPVKGCNAMWS